LSLPTVLRRLVVFTVLFGGAMAAVIWRAGGVEAPEPGRVPAGDGERAQLPDEELVPIDAGAGMGSGRGIRVRRDAVEVVGGEPISYRAFEASWERQRPLPGGTLEERRIHTEEFTALVFHRRPTAEEPRPPAVEGPDTTRLSADEAELTMRQGAAFRAHLSGAVRVVRHAPDEDLTLTTPQLDIERIEGSRGAEELHATTEADVRLEGSGTHLEGTGLEADLGRGGRGAAPPGRVTLLRDVSGRLLARRGALTSQGGDSAAEATPATFSCSGSADLVEQRAAASGRRGTTWLLVLKDDVVVEQGPVRMTCATLEIEFRRAALGGGPIEVLRAVADGGVVVHGTDEATADTWSLRAVRSVTQRDTKGGYDVDLEGGTILTFDGTLRGRGSADAETGRVEIRCAGTATLHTDPEPVKPGAPVRTRIVFRDDVVARQWDGNDALQTEIRAPEVTLLGYRGTTGDGRVDAETLVAQGTPEERVHVVRESLTAEAHAVTWRVVRDQDIERLLLSGRPSVRFESRGGGNLLGLAAADEPATLFLDAEERVEITWRHTPAADLNLPEGEPYVTALARDQVVVRRVVKERETYRLEARALDTTLDADLEARQMRAYGDVVVNGRGEHPGDRWVELRGDRLSATRVPGDSEEWVRTDVFVFGQEGARATAVIREPPDPDDPDAEPDEHVVTAEQLRYQDAGTLLTAKRNAEIVLARDESGEQPYGFRARGSELRAHLRPSADRAAGTHEVLRVEGEGGVELKTPVYSVRGRTVTYDRISGIAIARGRPARGVLLHPASESHPEDLESFVSSEEIRVEFDPTEERPGRPRRATCQGGLLRFFQIARNDEAPAALERVTLRATGPIEVLGEQATAQKDVEIVWESKPAGRTWTRDARVLADRVELDFDTESTGAARDRIRRAVATGSRSRAAQLFSPKIDATADRVESRGPWIDLMSPWGRSVHVKQRDPEQSFTCDKGRYNYVTQEFEATRARAE
jgi:hypothetical protein